MSKADTVPRVCAWCAHPSVVGDGTCVSQSTPCSQQPFTLTIPNGATCPTTAPTPQPTPATPRPTPDQSAPCASFGLCAQCVNRRLHPTRECVYCGSGCQDQSSVCNAAVNVNDVAQCPTPAPVRLFFQVYFKHIYFVNIFFIFLLVDN